MDWHLYSGTAAARQNSFTVCFIFSSHCPYKLIVGLICEKPRGTPQVTVIQGVAEPTGTFQTVIDNIWKQGIWSKPSINTSQYAIYCPQITGSFSAQQQMPSVYSNALLQACLPVAVRAALPVHINSTTVSCGLFVFLNCHGTAVLTVCQEPHREISVQWGGATERAERCRRNYEHR
jgi:hypothetical protein